MNSGFISLEIIGKVEIKVRKQKGFTLIELLVVIAILGIIATVVVLNVGSFFGRGTLQAANTELHQVQTAVISVMAIGETGRLGGVVWPVAWSGDDATIWADAPDGVGDVYDPSIDYDASSYLYGKLRATYYILQDGSIVAASCNGTGQWGSLYFCGENWQLEECGA